MIPIVEVPETKIFTKQVRLKRYGQKRLVIVHDTSDLSGTPRYYLTDALHWDSVRTLETWSYRWSSEIFHEFGKQVVGMESAQVREMSRGGSGQTPLSLELRSAVISPESICWSVKI